MAGAGDGDYRMDGRVKNFLFSKCQTGSGVHPLSFLDININTSTMQLPQTSKQNKATNPEYASPINAAKSCR
jgi:hypothetical protein